MFAMTITSWTRIPSDLVGWWIRDLSSERKTSEQILFKSIQPKHSGNQSRQQRGQTRGTCLVDYETCLIKSGVEGPFSISAVPPPSRRFLFTLTALEHFVEDKLEVEGFGRALTSRGGGQGCMGLYYVEKRKPPVQSRLRRLRWTGAYI